MENDIFSSVDILRKDGIVKNNYLNFIRVEDSNSRVVRVARPVLFLFPVPEQLDVSELESRKFYEMTATSLAILRNNNVNFGISYMVTGNGTVNYITSPDFNSGPRRMKETISTLRNSGILRSLGVRGIENTMEGIDPFIAYEGESVIGEAIVKGRAYENRKVRGIRSFFSFVFSKGYYLDADIWPLLEPETGTSFMNSVLDSVAEVQKRIAEGLNGRIYVSFDFRPVRMDISTGVVEIARKLNPPSQKGISSSQRLPVGNYISTGEEKALRAIKSSQFLRDRARSAIQVEVHVFAVVPRNEYGDDWRMFVEIISDKASEFFETGRHFMGEYSIPHASFGKGELSLKYKQNKNPLYLYAKNEFFKGIPGEKYGKIVGSRAVSVLEAARMFPITSQEMISNLRVITDKGRVNTLPAIEWLHQRVFGKKPDPSTLIDGYGQRTANVKEEGDQ